ncbi:hypothetical protein KSP40_PGU002723 [Platanthera guangdongensis]|uniref:DUF632 domain-containing protein n=1 Tax=Platanthera guangdongensis TaxID=2320717 RepID=A0ABR2LH24_9ASPA
MWKVMLECNQSQIMTISSAHQAKNSMPPSGSTDFSKQATMNLRDEAAHFYGCPQATVLEKLAVRKLFFYNASGGTRSWQLQGWSRLGEWALARDGRFTLMFGEQVTQLKSTRARSSLRRVDKVAPFESHTQRKRKIAYEMAEGSLKTQMHT